LLSVDPGNYDDAPAEGIRRVLEMASGRSIPRKAPIPKDLIRSIRMGTTVATNGEFPNGGDAGDISKQSMQHSSNGKAPDTPSS